MYLEAKSFAEETLAEALTSDPNHADPSRLASLAQLIVMQASELLSVSDVEKQIVERLYCELSCSMSEFRHLRFPSERFLHAEELQLCESLQRLPNELVLRSLQFILTTWPRSHPQPCVFPRLSRSTHRMSVQSPECLGVLDVCREQCIKMEKPKPHCFRCIDAQIGLYSGERPVLTCLSALSLSLLQSTQIVSLSHHECIAHGTAHSIAFQSVVALMICIHSPLTVCERCERNITDLGSTHRHRT